MTKLQNFENLMIIPLFVVISNFLMVQARVLKFHTHIPHVKTVFLHAELSPFENKI